MGVEERPELVGKRFLCVSGRELLELGEIAHWRWRAGVIRAVTHRDSDNPELMVYVEFDGLEWEKREWVKVHEGYRVFLLENCLVWAWRKDTTQLQGSKVKQIQWPALTFRPLVGKSVLGPVTAVEFLCDRRLDFLAEDGAYWPYEEEVASLNPVLRDNLQLHQEVCAWVKEQKIQHVFMRGPYSLNGHRVRVYRQDSATQWFSGIITHHDLRSRGMIVMNDQVLEPQNVDPSTVQMTFLDDIVHSLLKGENIGITSRRRTRTSQNGSFVPAHSARTQASSPRSLASSSSTCQVQSSQNSPGQQRNSSPVCTRDPHPNSVPSEHGQMGSEGPSPEGKDPSVIKSEAMANKRRKAEEERSEVKRRKAGGGCGGTESSDQGSRRTAEPPAESKSKGASQPRPQEEEPSHSAEGPEGVEAAPGEDGEIVTVRSVDRALRRTKTPPAPHEPGGGSSEAEGCGSGTKGTLKPSPAEESGIIAARTQTPPDMTGATEDCGRPRQGSGAASAPQPSQEAERHIPETRPGSECRSMQRRPELQDSCSEEAVPPSSARQCSAATPCVRNPALPQEVRTSLRSASPDVPRPRASPGPCVSTRDASPGVKRRGSGSRASAAAEGGGAEPGEPRVFKPVATRGSASEHHLSALIDKNQPFSLYRDLPLVRPYADTSHVTYLHPHLHPLHQPPRSACLAPPSPHHHPSHGLIHHPHLLPGMLPGLAPPSLLGGHPPLGAVGLAHHPHHQQPPSPADPSYNHLGLYPIVWQYPTLGPPSSKWGLPESSVSSETCLRRNTPSPWLPQHTPVTSPEGLGLLSHAPTRPASADPHPCSNPSVSNRTPEKEKQGFMEPMRAFTPTYPTPDLDRMRLPGAREGQLQRHFLDALPGQQRAPLGAGDRASRYKEESRRILQESIQVAPYTAKIRPSEGEREPYLAPPLAKSHALYRDLDPSPSEMYGLKSRVFPSLSSGEARQPYPSSPLPDPLFCGRSHSGPPPLIKHQAEEEGLVGKITERLSKERPQPPTAPDPLCCMPALHRAPVFHPPTQHALGCPEGGTARLSPPTLTPVPSVSSAEAGLVTGLGSEQQRPPTLLPEVRGEGGCGGTRGSLPEGWPPRANGGAKPQSAVASVITRADARPGPMSAGGILPGGGSEHASPLLRNCVRDAQGGAASPPKAPPNSSPPSAPGQGQSGETSAREKAEGSAPTAGTHSVRVQLDREALTPSPSIRAPQGLPYPNHFVHLKKHKAVLAAAQFQIASPAQSDAEAFPLPPPVSHADDVNKANSLTNGHPPPLGSPTNGYPSPPGSLTNGHPSPLGSLTNGHPSPLGSLTNGHTPAPGSLTNGHLAPPSSLTNGHLAPPGFLTNGQPAPPSQPNYHKLKKAWLTRHSEEDRNTKAARNPEIKPATISLTVSPSDHNSVTSENATEQEAREEQETREKQGVGEEQEAGEDQGAGEKLGVGEEQEAVEDQGAREELGVEEVQGGGEELGVEEIQGGGEELGVEEVQGGGEEQEAREELGLRKSHRAAKRSYKSASESAEDSDGSQSEHRAKRQAKPTYKKKLNELRKRRSSNRKEEEEKEEPRANGRSAKEKTRLKLASSNGTPRSVLKDWRKVRKLKQTGEAFLQDDSCSQVGPNLQKCRECRLARSRKGEEPGHSPVFCRFYYFRRLSYSKNGVVRIDGFSFPDQYDDEALSMWTPSVCEQNQLDLETSKYILSCIGDKFCQLGMAEIAAATCIKKNACLAWKRAVRGVREMCDDCEATLFNLHWVCQKCGFVVCVDCYRAKEHKGAKDKDLYPWLKCVKGQPHDPKHLMPTQIIPGTVLADLLNTMHTLREKFGIRSHCACSGKPNKIPSTNGVSQVLQNVLNHSNKMSLCKPHGGQEDPSLKAESDCRPVLPEPQSPLHFLADLAEQKSREEKKENKESPVGVVVKEVEQGEGVEALSTKPSVLGASGTEQGSTLRDLLTTTAGKLRLGSTDASMAFAPVYCSPTQTSKSSRSMPNILHDIIASVVENKIPAGKPRLRPKQEAGEEAGAETATAPPTDAPHAWLYHKRLLWLRDPRHPGNRRLFRESWEQGQPVVVSGIHRKLKARLWTAESLSQEFADPQGELVNCKDAAVSVSAVKGFWDGFEDLTKRRSRGSEAAVSRLKDWPSGEEFLALMPSRYDDLMANLPLPEYSAPEGSLNLASRLPPFFVQPDLGPRLCCAYGVVASQEQDFGTASLHLEVSDTVSILIYVGVAKGNGALSKTSLLKRLEEEDLDDGMKRRLKDSSETPGALWHIYASRDTDKIKEFLSKVAREQGDEALVEQDPIREPGWYLSRRLRDRLLEEQGVQGWTVLQFQGDAVLIPAGALHQVQNLHSCVQVINDFVSPEHVVHAFHLTQELRSSCQEVNYEDKLQIKSIFYHSVKDAVGTLKRSWTEEPGEAEDSL
ncbi:probable JmjC domain-containing histone demethylation protein 2C [Anguilla rostrata]|uniref:probable JmjC domain-containing histone demethylation protein 2C n=1 Tax=Anguilla rostrata TaxID=7938 RepID=UPI0030CB52D0